MTRTIKFRAWDKKHNKMRQPSVNMLVDSYNGTAWWQFGYNVPEPMEVILIQSTGLLDKNGKEIWEGDIVCFVEDVAVETIGGHPRYEPEGKFVEVRIPDFFISIYNEEVPPVTELEIIGNIYENPELLE